jgi:hypothetical protein
MSTRSIEAGRAFLKLMVEDAQFKKGLDGSLRKLENFGKSLTSIGVRLGAAGAALGAPFALSLRTFAKVGSELHDMSMRTGLSVESLSELKFAAEQSGQSLDTIGLAVRAMQKNGFDPRTFDAVASEIAAIADPTARAQKAFETFGTRAGAALLPMLQELPQLRDRARELGLTMSGSAAKDADALGDALDALKASLSAIGTAIGGAVAPTITHLAEVITANTGTIVEWVRANRSLVVSIGAVSGALLGLGGALTIVGASLGRLAGIATLSSKALAFLRAHPYVAAAGLVLTAVTALAAKFGLFSSAVDESAQAQENLTDKTNEATVAITKQNDALRDQVKHAQAIAKLQRDIQQTNADEATLLGLGAGSSVNGLDLAGVRARRDRLKAQLRALQGLSESSPAKDLFGPDFGEAFASLFRKVTHPLQFGANFAIGRGKPGFDINQTQLASAVSSLGIRGGELAEQIFGTGVTGGVLQQQLRTQEVMADQLRKIERHMSRPAPKNSFSPIRNGLA